MIPVTRMNDRPEKVSPGTCGAECGGNESEGAGRDRTSPTYHKCPRCGEWIEDETIPDGCEDILDCPEQGNG